MPTSDSSTAVPEEIQIHCHIGPSSRTISPEIGLWAESVASKIRSSTTGQLTALVWPYRHAENDFLSVDIGGVTGHHTLTFMTGLAHDFSVDDVAVPDMIEAFVMAMVVLSKVQAIVKFHI